jgi:hypothetical protein
LLELNRPSAGVSIQGFSDTITAGDTDSGAGFVGSALLVGILAVGVIGAAGYALVKGPGELKEAVNTGMSTGLDKLRQGGHAARSAAEQGKRIVSVLPSGIPFEVPRVFRTGATEYEDVDDEGSGKKEHSLSARLPMRGGKGYGSIAKVEENSTEDGQEPAQEPSLFGFSKLFPQLQAAGESLIRKSKSETALQHLLPTRADNKAAADETEESKGVCMVCEGRSKMGVEGPCGLCLARGNDDKC